MASFIKRTNKKGKVRWTVLVRKRGRNVTKTFPTKGAGDTWASAQELSIDTGVFVPIEPGAGKIFADLVDLFLEHRKRIKRPLGKTATHTIERLKVQHGLEPIHALTEDFWRKHVLKRMADVTSQTAAQDLLYASVVVRHAADEGINVARDAPGRARAKLRDNDGLRVTSRARSGRISDDELEALLGWIDDNKARTHIPLGDIVRFALATSMRRGEILTIRHEDLKGRVVLVRNRKHPRDHERVDRVPLLRPHPQWPRDDALEIIGRQPTRSGRIFPYLGDTIGFWFETAVAGAGLQGNVVFHLLRHESLSRYAERGMDIMRLQLIGGHRDIRHLQRYVELDAERLAVE
jgi:integrase